MKPRKLSLRTNTIRTLTASSLADVRGGYSGNRCTTAHTWQCTDPYTYTEPSGTGTLNSHDPCPP